MPIVPAPDPEAVLGDDWNPPEDATSADDLVAAVEEGALDVELAPGADRADRGELGSHPGVEAAVRTVRHLLEADREE